MLKQFFSRVKPVVMLGRWEHRLNDKQKEIKFLYNNLDHCGDTICGDMRFYNKNKPKVKTVTGSRKISPELFQV